jgi:hypothetical protein
MVENTATQILFVKIGTWIHNPVGIFHPHSFANSEVSEAVSGSFFRREYTVQ